MLGEGSLRQDFRFRGFPNQSMFSPRQPITTTTNDDKARNEENFVKVFGKSSVFDPGNKKMNIENLQPCFCGFTLWCSSLLN